MPTVRYQIVIMKPVNVAEYSVQQYCDLKFLMLYIYVSIVRSADHQQILLFCNYNNAQIHVHVIMSINIEIQADL